MADSRFRFAFTSIVVLALAGSLIVSGCTSTGDGGNDESPPQSESPAIRGTITDVTPVEDGDFGTILVEGQAVSPSGFDKASLRLDGDTVIEDADGAAVLFRDLTVGLTVEAWVSGPVAESYPVQAYASKVRVLE